MTKDKLLKEIRSKIRAKYEKNSDAAKELGMSDSNLSNILAGRTLSIPKKVLDLVGYEAVQTEEMYRKKVKS